MAEEEAAAAAAVVEVVAAAASAAVEKIGTRKFWFPEADEGTQGHTTTPLTLRLVTTAGSFQMIIVKCKKVVNFYTQVQSVNILELILSKSTKQYQV